MPHLVEMQWDHKNQLRMVDLGGGGKAYYVYDSAGQRMRKVWEKSAALVEERIYLGGYEIFRQRQSGNLKLERETLHIMDDNQRIALVETKTYDETEVASPAPITRYLHGNHLGSASLELDAAGALISYEEYYPYGSTSYHSAPGGLEVSLNRYRYTGKERDEETGLYYYGRRYYAPWLGRWTAADPAGLVDGPNLYHYAQNNPINLTDPNGMQSETKIKEAVAQMLKESERPTLPPAAAAEEPVVIALGRFKFYGKTGAKMDLTKDVVALAANQTGMEAKIIGQLDVMKSATDPSKVGYDPTQVWNALAPKTPGRPVMGLKGGVALVVTPEAPLGMQSAMHVQHVLSGEAKAGGQAVTAIHFNTTGIPLFPAVETAGHTEAELRSVLAAVASEQHKVDIYIKEGDQVLKIPAGQSVIEGGPVPARFQQYLPNVVEAKPKPPAPPPPPAAAAPLAAEAGAVGKGLTVAGLTEGALKVAKFGGQVLTLYGAVTQAAETARQSPSGPVNKFSLYVVGTALGVVAGVADDAMAATGVFAPVVLDSWEKKNAGPAQVEVNRLLRAFDRWCLSTF
jgi:RHS repeat-associated protein